MSEVEIPYWLALILVLIFGGSFIELFVIGAAMRVMQDMQKHIEKLKRELDTWKLGFAGSENKVKELEENND